jgi:DNA polymerase III epsilon subunit-like protein
MTVIIVDVETSGLPIGRNAHYQDLTKYENARIVQISYMICDRYTLEEKEIRDHVIKADGFSIDNHQFHWVTNEISQEQGVPFVEVAKEFAEYLEDATHVLAHNADFDINIIKSELHRYGLHDIIDDLCTKEIICTMKSTMNMVNVRNRYGVKFPTLTELYAYVFDGGTFENAHNAKYDVIYLHKAIKELYATGKFMLP